MATNDANILPYLDTLWGLAEQLDEEAEETHARAQQLRDYIVLIKQAAGLESPKG